MARKTSLVFSAAVIAASAAMSVASKSAYAQLSMPSTSKLVDLVVSGYEMEPYHVNIIAQIAAAHNNDPEMMALTTFAKVQDRLMHLIDEPMTEEEHARRIRKLLAKGFSDDVVFTPEPSFTFDSGARVGWKTSFGAYQTEEYLQWQNSFDHRIHEHYHSFILLDALRDLFATFVQMASDLSVRTKLSILNRARADYELELEDREANNDFAGSRWEHGFNVFHEFLLEAASTAPDWVSVNVTLPVSRSVLIPKV
jgi:ribulose bisphosphate carboxylase small subunit